MAWEARSGLKRSELGSIAWRILRLNGLGSPFGIETKKYYENRSENARLNGLGSPFGIETTSGSYTYLGGSTG